MTRTTDPDAPTWGPEIKAQWDDVLSETSHKVRWSRHGRRAAGPYSRYRVTCRRCGGQVDVGERGNDTTYCAAGIIQGHGVMPCRGRKLTPARQLTESRNQVNGELHLRGHWMQHWRKYGPRVTETTLPECYYQGQCRNCAGEIRVGCGWVSTEGLPGALLCGRQVDGCPGKRGRR